MANKEIIITIKDGKADVQLGAGWPPGVEASEVARDYLNGLGEITLKQHRPHTHRKERNVAKVHN